jgi:hypothetical protein
MSCLNLQLRGSLTPVEDMGASNGVFGFSRYSAE